MEWKEYYEKRWNEQGCKGEEGTEEKRRSEGTDDSRGRITTEELNRVLKHAKNRKSCGLDNLPMTLWKFGRNKLKIQLLELFNKITDKIKCHKNGERNGDKHTQKRSKKQMWKLENYFTAYSLQIIYKHNLKNRLNEHMEEEMVEEQCGVR